MLFEFQVGVHILYIVWRRAVRDCTAILSIFADRSPNADVYRDCLDILASSISRADPPGSIDPESWQELAVLVGRIEEVGLALNVSTKLAEMSRVQGVANGME
jgi:hypothetical protein